MIDVARLRQIADEMQELRSPGLSSKCEIGGRLLDEAIGSGALAGPEYAAVRVVVLDEQNRSQSHWQCQAFLSAFAELEPDSEAHGPESEVDAACRRFAKIIRAEADRLERSGSPPPLAGGGEAESGDRHRMGFPVPPATHSRDFTTVQWYGSEYTFTKTQAACVKVLWEEWERQTPAVKQETILEAAGSSGNNVRDVFKSKKGMHVAWGKMMVEAGKGCFRLQEPEKRQPGEEPAENPT